MSDPEAIRADILTMVGGQFTPAAVGPEAYQATLARIRAQAGDYLDVFEDLFLGLNFDAERQSRLYLPTFLGQLRDVAPERVRALAEHLERQYGAILVVFDQVADRSMLDQMLPSASADFLLRLNDRRLELRRLIAEP